MPSSVDTNQTQFNVNVVKSEAVFEEMKKAGLPPRQIFMTPDAIGNIDCLRTEIIYDRLDSSKNLNKPDGIMGNVPITIDLSKYEYIEVVPEIYNLASLNTGGWSGMYKLDLTTKKLDNDWNVAGYSAAYADDAQSADINKVTWNFSLFYQASSKTFKWLLEFNGVNYNNNANSFISKIYGILKNPAAIYTGFGLDELLDRFYPVGSIYTSIENVSPASTLGGTWEQLPAGYALWTASSGAGSTISAGLPNITGAFWAYNYDSAYGSGAFSQSSANSNGCSVSDTNTEYSYLQFNANNGATTKGIYGNSTTVQPPAYKVYAWKRIS